MSDISTLLTSVVRNLFQNQLFWIYSVSILISIIGDIKVSLRIEKRFAPNDIVYTNDYNTNKSKNKFLLSVGIILFVSIISLNFDYFSVEKSLTVIAGIFILCLIYFISHSIAEFKVAQSHLTKDEEIIAKLTSDLDIVHIILAPVKALIYMFLGIKNILSKKSNYE